MRDERDVAGATLATWLRQQRNWATWSKGVHQTVCMDGSRCR